MKQTLGILLSTLLLHSSAFAVNGQCSGEITEPQGPGLLFRSLDSGNSWQDVSYGLPERIRVSSAFAQGTSFYLGTSDGDLYHTLGPETGNWLRQGIAGMTPTQSIAGIYPGISGTFVHIYEAGLFLKPTEGTEWQYLTAGMEGIVVNDLVEINPGVILISSASGIHKSEDKGQTWQLVFKGWVRNLVQEGDVILGNGFDGIIRSEDSGMNWEVVLKEPGSDYNFSNIGGQLVAIGFGGSWRKTEVQRIFVSTDTGASWNHFKKFTPCQPIYQVEQVGECLFYTNSNGISRSMDGGQTWEVVHTLRTDELFVRFNLLISGGQIYAVAIPVGC